METNKILTADILDLIFEGRYKEYGAYELRKTYNKRIKAGLIGMIAVVAVLGAMAIISNSIKKPKTEIVAVDMSLENVAQDEKKSTTATTSASTKSGATKSGSNQIYPSKNR